MHQALGKWCRNGVNRGQLFEIVGLQPFCGALAAGGFSARRRKAMPLALASDRGRKPAGMPVSLRMSARDRRGTPCFMPSSPTSVLSVAEESADASPSSGRRFAEAGVPALLGFSPFLDQACAHRRRLAEFRRAEPRTGHRRRAPLGSATGDVQSKNNAS